MKAQGSELYLIDPADSSVLPVGCLQSIEGIDTTLEQNEVTCLQDLVRRYEPGLATPGAATFAIYTDPSDPTHVRLHQLKVAGTELKWALGWSEDTGTPPTVGTDSNGDDEFVLPDSRSWLIFDGFMNAYSFNFTQNASVTSQIGIQISGEPTLIAIGAS